MSKLQRNLLANFAGRGLIALLSFAFIPIYISILGIEAYGLIGFYAVMVGVFAVADAGIGATLNREMARLSVVEHQAKTMRDTLRTLEIVYLLISIGIAAIVIIGAPFIAENWVQTTELSAQTVQRSVVLMGCAIAFQFPLGLYQGGMIGLQRQITLNIILVLFAFIRYVGAVALLTLISPTIWMYFVWQTLLNVVLLVLLRQLNWVSLPSTQVAPAFSVSILRSVWRFSLSMLGISMISVLLTQSDKLIVSRLVPLEVFGYYTLAATVAQTLTMVSGPMINAVFPQMTQLVMLDLRQQLITVFHSMCQLMSVLVIPVGLTLIVFSYPLLVLWTNNVVTADNSAALVSLFTIGSLFLALQVIPYALALANGWTKLNLLIGVVTLVTVIPTMIALVMQYGAIGGAIAWIMINGLSTPFFIHFLLRRLLPGQELHWYLQDVGAPFFSALAVILAGKAVTGYITSPTVMLLAITGAYVGSSVAAVLAAPATRRFVVLYMRSKFRPQYA